MSSGIYVYLPTAQKPDKEATKKVPEKERSHSPIKYPDAKEPSISSESDAKPNKDGVLLNAISLIEARSLLEPLVKSLLGVSPKYIFEKRKNGAQVVYDCMMLIQAKYPPKEKMYLMFEGSYQGTGLSKRLALMDACKNAMMQWDTQEGVLILDMSFSQYVNTILREGKQK